MVFKIVSGTSYSTFCNDTFFMANSRWTADAFRRAYGIEAQVVYPAVMLSFNQSEDIAADATTGSVDRETGFVTIGRLVPDKRIHDAISIIDNIRDDLPDAHLHIVGDGSGSYAARIRRMAKRREHVHLHRHLSRDGLSNLLRSHAYGLHTTRNEHFGIAPAEISRAGAIVFVHDSGGQIEITGNSAELCFKDNEEAARKIIRVVDNEKLQDKLKKRLLQINKSYLSNNFKRRIRKITGQVLRSINCNN
jgi:glycosyltransferase involved in cell wall biosynthesis